MYRLLGALRRVGRGAGVVARVRGPGAPRADLARGRFVLARLALVVSVVLVEAVWTLVVVVRFTGRAAGHLELGIIFLGFTLYLLHITFLGKIWVLYIWVKET